MDKLTVLLTEAQALKDLAYDIEIEIYRGGSDDQVIPTSVTLTIKSPGGKTIIDEISPSVSAGGTITYEVAAASIDSLWENAQIILSYTDDNSNAQKETLLFDVVRSILKNTVVDSNLTDYEPDLGSHRWSGQTSYYEQINAAFNELWDDIQNKGKRPALLIDGYQIKQLTIYKALAIICFAFAKDVETDVWWFKYQKWEDKYNTEFEKRVVAYDEDKSGRIDPDEQKELMGALIFNR